MTRPTIALLCTCRPGRCCPVCRREIREAVATVAARRVTVYDYAGRINTSTDGMSAVVCDRL